jgi:hypothetical protein
VNSVRALFHAQLHQLLHTLARMTPQTGQMITHAPSRCTRLIPRSPPLVIIDRDRLIRLPTRAAHRRR